MNKPSSHASWHIFKKDFRQQRYLFIAWLLIVLSQLALVTVGADPGDQAKQITLTALAVFMPLLGMLLLFVLVPFLIHAEPQVGTTSYWFTRPVSSMQLLQAKGLFALLLVALPWIMETVVLAANGATIRQLLLATPEILLTGAAALVGLAALAAVSGSFGGFAVVAVSYFVIITLISSAITITQLFFDTSSLMAAGLNGTLLQSRAMASMVLMLFVGTGVVLHQYRTREVFRSFVLIAIGLLLSIATAQFWPIDFLRPRLPEASRAGLPFPVENLEPRLGSVHSSETISWRGGDNVPSRTVTVNFGLKNLPPEFVYSVVGLSPKLLQPDGKVVSIKPAPATNSPDTEANSRAIQAALNGVVLVNGNYADTTNLPLFNIKGDEFVQNSSRPLQFSARLELVFSTYEIETTLPLRKGAVYEHHATRLTITDVLKQSHEHIEVMLRKRDIQLLLEGSGGSGAMAQLLDQSSVRYVLMNRQRGEAILPSRNMDANFGQIFGAAQRLQNTPVRLSFKPERNDNLLFPNLNDAWLEDAELVVLKLKPVASWQHELSIPEFRMDGTNHRSSRSDKIKLSPENLAHISLPPAPDEDAVREYIRAILLASRDQNSFSKKDPQIPMLVEIGPANFEILAGFNKSGHDYHVVEALQLLAREEHKEWVVAELGDTPALAAVVRRMDWSEAARNTLMAAFEKKDFHFSSDWIACVVDLQDPVTYPVLKKFFRDHRYALHHYSALSTLPGLDLSEEVGLLWTKSRHKAPKDNVSVILAAVDYGHKDALMQATELFPTAQGSTKRNLREVLRARTGQTGSDEEIVLWITENAGQLEFDKATGLFEIADPS